MKKSITLSLLFASSIAGFTYGQGTTQRPTLEKNIENYNPSRPAKVDSYQQPYIIQDKKLATFFISGSIPPSFPKYNYDLNKEDNAKMIKNWLNQNGNMSLLSNEGLAKLEELKNKK